ncbi:hypothetical protein SOASR030_37450 [Leminorella grimontii]|uniref:Mor transcription activator domain-containing protein n=1 Tax=Leminorella grimontii TaxID=82981 RepID=A0AAV5N842_9GAMM|nr:Mor transcription activator family protein [Leminorella grimontii]KFC92467.1 putative transcription regulator [Leminorella grimontii ATCC 33999 = DSM 5078]GKX57633.1 hypothetical protein SOASR030_37450 [Leminorella grimontii]VFS55859.1 Uncharacterized conserved protein [Leminorella grimontii]
MNDNLDLFTTEHNELAQLLDRLDTIPPEEIRDKWPRFLVDLVDVLAHELARLDVSEAQLVAMKLAICISNYFGGRAVYLPTGEVLRAALRDYEIYAQFCGNNIDELIEKYGLTQSHIYDILRKQRQLHRRRYQPDMLDALE